MRRIAIALSVAAACAALLTACGTGDSDSSTTGTVPSGTLGAGSGSGSSAGGGSSVGAGTGSATTFLEGRYTGTTATGLSITFTVQHDKVLDFMIAKHLFAASMLMHRNPPSLYYHRTADDVVTGAWQTPSRITGAITQRELDGKKVRTTWQATSG